MKSLDDLVAYYRGVSVGAVATSEMSWPSNDSLIRDDDRVVDAALLYDADRLVKASLTSFLACSRLRAGGYATWGDISLYYSRFFCIGALLRLVGRADHGQRVLLRTSEERREYIRVKVTSPEAREAGCGGGSHKGQWRMFSRYFERWTAAEPPGASARVLGEDPIMPGSTAWYEFETEERNDANYLKSHAGIFFPETDFSGMEGHVVEEAKAIGSWDYLRTDASPYGDDEPPEAWFAKEMMSWDLIRFTIGSLVTLQGQSVLSEYLWLLENLEAHQELREHMITDLRPEH